MNTEPKDGGRAFPHLETTSLGQPCYDHLGMSLRDWFAGQALVGLLAVEPSDCAAGDFARSAFQMADAMLKAREQKE